MTYSQAKIIPSEELTSSIPETLELGFKAAAEQDWLLVCSYLQLLPFPKTEIKSNPLPAEYWESAFQLALEVLLQGDFQQKWAVVKIIPFLGQSIVQPLITLLENENTDIEVRWFICKILGRFEDKGIVIALTRLLQQTDEEELIAVAYETLTEIGTTAIDALVDLLSQAEYRLLAVKSLAYIRQQEIIEPLLTVVNDPQPEIKTIAIEALGSFHDDRIPPILIVALKDTNSSVRKEAAIALGFRPDLCLKLNLVDHLQPLLYDLNLEVCTQAAIALGRMKNEAAVTALFEMLKSPTTPENLQLDLVKALAWSEIELAVEYLSQALLIVSERVAQEIITVLGRISLSKLKPKIVGNLIDFWHLNTDKIQQHTRIKQVLASSLGQLESDRAMPILSQLAVDENKIVQLHAIAAIKKLSNN